MLQQAKTNLTQLTVSLNSSQLRYFFKLLEYLKVLNKFNIAETNK